MAIYISVSNSTAYKNVSTPKRNIQQKEQLSLLNETLNDFVIDSNTNLGIIENDFFGSKSDGQFIFPERIVAGEINACQKQNIRRNFEDEIRKVVDTAVKNVKNCMQDATLTTVDSVIIPRVELAVRSIIGSLGHGPDSTVQNRNKRDFIGSTKIPTFKSPSSPLDLNINQDRTDETHDIERFKDSDFPA